jgi:hypothetical protein
MQQPRIKPVTKSLQPLRTIQVTDSELIFLQAALHHYQDFIRPNQELYQQAAPLIQNFILRLRDQLPPRKDQIERQ